MEVREKKHQSVLISLNRHLLDTGLKGPIKYRAICATCQTWTTSSGAKAEEGTCRKRRERKRFLLLSTAAWHFVLLGTIEPLCAPTSPGRSPEAPAYKLHHFFLTGSWFRGLWVSGQLLKPSHVNCVLILSLILLCYREKSEGTCRLSEAGFSAKEDF